MSGRWWAANCRAFDRSTGGGELAGGNRHAREERPYVYQLKARTPSNCNGSNNTLMIKMLVITISALGAGLFVMSTGAADQAQQPIAVSHSIAAPAPNPHWRSDGCATCHVVEHRKMNPIPAEQVDLLCLSCHDGVKAKREPHPIGRSFAGDQVRRPESWPTPGGLLSCITCHDVLRGCDSAPLRPKSNPAMLRGKHADTASFCGECHITERHQQYNPHMMIRDAASGTTQSCMFCHQQEMHAGNSAVRSGEPMLKTDEITLCGQCHKEHVDFFSPGHIGAAVTPQIMEAMLRTDARVLRSETSTPSALPLSKGIVTCSTCHNPHQTGVFPSDHVLALGAMEFPKQQSGQVAMRLQGRELCSACHGF